MSLTDLQHKPKTHTGASKKTNTFTEIYGIRYFSFFKCIIFILFFQSSFDHYFLIVRTIIFDSLYYLFEDMRL